MSVFISFNVKALTILEQADIAYQQGDLKKSTKYYEYELSKNKNSIPAKIGLAKAYAASNKLNKSATLYNELLVELPNDYDIQLNLSFVYMHQKKWLLARNILTQLYALDNNNIQVMNWLMSIYVQMGELELAEELHQLIKKQNKP